MYVFKTLFLIALSSLSFQTFSQCVTVDGKYEFSVTISNETFDLSYSDEQVQLTESDYALVKNLETNREVKFNIGVFTNDGAGNFTIEAISAETAAPFYLDHDHEAWHYGLSGEFVNEEGIFIDLSKVTDCSFDDLFT